MRNLESRPAATMLRTAAMGALWALGAVAAGALGPRPALAGEVVVYGPGTPSPELAARAETVFRVAAAREAAPSAGLAHVLDLPFPAQDPVWMAGGLLPLPCADSSFAELDPKESLAQTRALVDELSYDKALLAVDRGIRALPCTAHEIDKVTLIQLHFFQGLAEFMVGDKGKARRAFAAALAIDVQTPWDRAYPPDPQQLWLEAAQEIVTRGSVKVGVDVRGGGIQSLSVDGGALSIAGPLDLELRQGRHLVRWVDAQGAAFARLVDVSGKGGALVTRPALRDAVLNLAWGGSAAPAARLALADLAGNRGADSVYVVVLDDGGGGGAARAFQYDVAGDAVLPLQVQAGALAAAEAARAGTASAAGGKGNPSDAGRLGLTFGGGLLYEDRAPYGMGALRLHVRLVKGLELGAGFQAGFRQFTWIGEDGSERRSAIILPQIAIDARYRLEPGPFHFYFGGRGILGFSNRETVAADETARVLGGGAGLIGFDITPAGDKGFQFNLELAAGGISGIDAQHGGFLLSLGAGLGARL